MRKTPVLLFVFLLAITMVGAAEESPALAVKEVATETEAPPTCGPSVEEIVAAFQLEAEKSAIPPCPTNTTCQAGGVACVGNTPCAPNGSSTFTDTGERKCDDGDPPPFMCPQGETIHIETRVCLNCPCCFTSPACFCPILCAGSAVVGFECR